MTHVSKPIDMRLLDAELVAAGVPMTSPPISKGIEPGTASDQDIYMIDANGDYVDLPPEALPVLEAHDASKPARAATFEQAEDAERLRVIAERAKEDPAFRALADLTLGKLGVQT